MHAFLHPSLNCVSIDRHADRSRNESGSNIPRSHGKPRLHCRERESSWLGHLRQLRKRCFRPFCDGFGRRNCKGVGHCRLWGVDDGCRARRQRAAVSGANPGASPPGEEMGSLIVRSKLKHMTECKLGRSFWRCSCQLMQMLVVDEVVEYTGFLVVEQARGFNSVSVKGALNHRVYAGPRETFDMRYGKARG